MVGTHVASMLLTGQHMSVDAHEYSDSVIVSVDTRHESAQSHGLVVVVDGETVFVVAGPEPGEPS